MLRNPLIISRTDGQSTPSRHISFLLLQRRQRSLAAVLQGDSFRCRRVELDQCARLTINGFGEDVELCVMTEFILTMISIVP